jgi:lysozyme
LDFALDEGKQIFPVLYRECKRPFRIHSAQYADFTASYDAGLKMLLESFGVPRRPLPPEPPPESPPRPARTSRRFIAYAAVIVALIAAGGYVAYKNTAGRAPSTDPSKSVGRPADGSAAKLAPARYSPDPARLIPAEHRALGIDVSHADGDLPWAEIAAAGYSFAIMKATQGTKSADARFQANWEGARKAGLIRGAYHFFIPADRADSQADLFLNTVALQPGDLPLAVDVEAVPFGPSASTADLVFRLGQLLTILESRTGRAPILYTPRSFSEQNFQALTSLNAYPLWLGQYSTSDQPKLPSSWSTWTFWQFTDRQRVGSRNFDSEYFNGTHKDLQEFAGRK